MESNIKYFATNRTEFARRYKVSVPTFNKWLALIQDLEIIDKQRIFTPKQVSTIVNHLGEPPD